MSHSEDEIERHAARLSADGSVEDFDTRIHFLHWVIDDTQDTVRFLDTKAAFCVTLFSGMVAVSLEHPLHAGRLVHVLFGIFITLAGCGLLCSLRVIFPTIRPHSGNGPRAGLKFFIGAVRGNRWLHHTLSNPRENIVTESHASYAQRVLASDEHEVISSMAETAVTLAFIRQLKSDRLHTAMYCLALAILLFAVILLLQL